MNKKEIIVRLEDIKETLYPIDKEAKNKIDTLISDISYEYKKYRD